MIKIILGQGVDVEQFASEVAQLIGSKTNPTNQANQLPCRRLYDSVWMLDYQNNHWLRQLRYDGSWMLEARYDYDRQKLAGMLKQIQRMQQVTVALVVKGYD